MVAWHGFGQAFVQNFRRQLPRGNPQCQARGSPVDRIGEETHAKLVPSPPCDPNLHDKNRHFARNYGSKKMEKWQCFVHICAGAKIVGGTGFCLRLIKRNYQAVQHQRWSIFQRPSSQDGVGRTSTRVVSCQTKAGPECLHLQCKVYLQCKPRPGVGWRPGVDSRLYWCSLSYALNVMMF